MAFHFGLPHAAGGFLGVDVFFVLSGYLITSICSVRSNAVTSRSSTLTRRMRRRIPALLALVAVVVVWSAVFAPRDVARRPVGRHHRDAVLLCELAFSSRRAATSRATSVASPFNTCGRSQSKSILSRVAAPAGSYALIVRQPRRRLIAVGVLPEPASSFLAITLSSLW